MPPLILGGGPAGAAAAIVLARAGTRATLIERHRDTGDALCGGFLSWRTLDALAALGIERDRLSRDSITRVRLFANGRVAEAPLPAPAIAVSRRHLDTLLLDHAATLGTGVERGVAARAVDGRTIRTADGATLTPDTLFLATGKHDVRGAARPASARGDDPTLGLRQRRSRCATLDRLVGDAIELHLFERGYAGIARQEDGSTNICLAVHRSRLDAAGDPERLLLELSAESPALGERLCAGHGSAIEAVANVPYGWRATAGTPGCFRLGDQAAVIPSLAGEGMGIALASGTSAARAWLADGERAAPDWQRDFARRTARPLRIAGTVRALAERPAVAAPLLSIAARTGLIHVIARLTRIDHATH